MKKKLAYLVFLVFFVAYSQEEASNWYFGDNAGVRFNADGSVISLADGRLATEEGCATISDENGNLLFYTDGITVYNKLHQAMPNANGLPSNILYGDPSSTQSGIIVPKPDDSNIYYIFTVDTSIGNGDPDRGFNYSIVDLTLNGGLGDVIPSSKNINLLQDSSEKISAVVKDCETKSVWVITFASANGLPFEVFNTFHAYEVSNTGVNTTPVSTTFNSLFIDDPRGYLKFSPNGSKIALANSTSGLYLFDFDTETGVVSNSNAIDITYNNTTLKPQSAYGLEFSPNNNILYVSTYYNPTRQEFNIASEQYGALLQYDITATDISASEFVLDNRQTYRGALQLAPNGKIYRSLSNTYNNGTPNLGVVNNPNEFGLITNYVHNAVTMNNNSRQGLPPFITSFFSEKVDIIKNEFSSTYLPLCIGEKFILEADNIAGATYTWKKDGILLSETDFDLEVVEDGKYTVFIETVSLDCDNTLVGEALVEYFDVPIANQPNDIVVCDTDNDGNYNFDFSLYDNAILGAQNPDIYIVSYHSSQNDADLNQNEIISPYNNGATNPQEIFIRLGLKSNSTCYDTSKSFMIHVYNTPIANNVTNDLIVCDAETSLDINTSNGQVEIDLHQFDTEIFGNQSNTDYYISYYSNITDAENRNTPLNFNYYNQTPFQEKIYARIENVLHTDCFDISEPINIIINPLPEFTNTTLLQCDEDGLVDGLTVFNLNQANEDLTGGVSGLSTKFYSDSARTLLVDGDAFVNTSNPQYIYVEVINDATKCFNNAVLTLEVSTTQISNYNAPPVCDELNSEDGFNTFNLDDFTSNIQAINNINHPISYYETYEDALQEKNELNTTYQNSIPYSQTIFARAENNNNCYGISEVLLTVNELPDIETEDLTYYCLNFFPETITVNAGLFDSPTNYNYNWSTGETSYEIDINKIGNYTVSVTNANGCSKERTIVVEASNIATFNTPIPYKVDDVKQNNSIEVFVTGEGIYQYSLLDQNNLTYKPYQDSNIFENVSPGIYNIAVKDVKNDCGTEFKPVSVVGFPKFFTPNNDGVNDTWQVIGVSGMFQPNTKIKIFNRFGKLIKELTPTGEGWDGVFNGQKLPSDDYWFSVILQDGRIFKNHFTLKN